MPDGQPPLARMILAFALGIVFLATGSSKLIDHSDAVADFSRWGLPAPSALTIAVGVFELCAAGLLMANIATRRVALALAVEMAAAFAIAAAWPPADAQRHPARLRCQAR